MIEHEAAIKPLEETITGMLGGQREADTERRGRSRRGNEGMTLNSTLI